MQITMRPRCLSAAWLLRPVSQRPVQIGQQEAECQNATGAAATDDFAMLLLADADASEADTIYEV